MLNNLIIIVPFSVLGGLMAAINVYREMMRHVGPGRARRLAVSAGITTFCLLVALGIAAALFMPYLVR